MVRFLLASTIMASASMTSALSVCAGEGPRYGDFKCDHDETHRVCATLVNNKGGQCKELSWGTGDFWSITGQSAWNWKKDICAKPNPGAGWCICMWATAKLIEKVGCDNVHLDCAATDTKWVMSHYTDGGQKLHAAHACLVKKCGAKAEFKARR